MTRNTDDAYHYSDFSRDNYLSFRTKPTLTKNPLQTVHSPFTRSLHFQVPSRRFKKELKNTFRVIAYALSQDTIIPETSVPRTIPSKITGRLVVDDVLCKDIRTDYSSYFSIVYPTEFASLSHLLLPTPLQTFSQQI